MGDGAIPMITLWGLPVEATMLVLAVCLGLVQVVMSATTKTMHRGLGYALGPRDEPGAPVGIFASRIERALENFKETFPLFAVAVLVAAASGRLNATTAWGAELYLLGRLLFVPLYAFGVPVARTVVWFAALIGIIAILVGATTIPV